MAENDIYNNQLKYETFKQEYATYTQPPTGKRKFQIKNKDNLVYVEKLLRRLEAKDTSYIRRLRILSSFKLVLHYIDKKLDNVDRDDIDQLIIDTHQNNKSDKTRACFKIDLKYIWKIILPEKDSKGRIDDTLIPYPVRHLENRTDKSRQKIRQDRMTNDEYQQIMKSFSNDTRMQALLSIIFESLGRPQELLGRNIADVEIFDNYAQITISEHGKEGIGILRVIDSYYYLTKWLNQHPLKHDPTAPLFINQGQRNQLGRFTPYAANKKIKKQCKQLKINKPITLYSFKRNGVTHCRLRGDSDVDIQHRARWTSTKQLSTYDLSNQKDSFKQELIQRGIINTENTTTQSINKECPYCKHTVPTGENYCPTCQRPQDKQTIQKHQNRLTELEQQIEQAKKRDEILLKIFKGIQKQGLMNEIINAIKKEGIEEEITTMN